MLGGQLEANWNSTATLAHLIRNFLEIGRCNQVVEGWRRDSVLADAESAHRSDFLGDLVSRQVATSASFSALPAFEMKGLYALDQR